jgi:uncharacterized protein YyaL (SSP411 family)
MPNRLIDETSPYLRHHAHNPVDWYPWGKEALDRAKAEEKPILVSIGYSACHWCHVMERESFEDEEIARQMNEQFVCIKVDREERPDLDSIYMQAVQALFGRGGWPLTAFLTPEGKPFYGGTYFPPEDRANMPGFPRVLQSVADAYRDNRDGVLRAATDLTRSIQAAAVAQRSQEQLDEALLRKAYDVLASHYDDTDGGFGDAPKFPQPMPLEFLLRYAQRTGDAHAQQMVERTLEAMAYGGIYDQLGGGFHRYSTDAQWLVPHFEKMLYDNALTTQVYLQAYQVTGRSLYRRVAQETLDYLLREMRNAGGGFYSSQDADSEGVEGKYYIWSAVDVFGELGDDAADTFLRYYGVTPEGDFEGENVLNVPRSPAQVAEDMGITEDDLEAALQPIKLRLLEERSRRVPPDTDDKVLTAWNALALRALAQAASVLGNETYRRAAEENGAFLLDHLHRDGRLLRTWKDGRAHLKAYLEDYALLVLGLLSLHEATSSHRWLHAARQLTDEMLALFWDDEQQAMFDVGSDHEELVVRPRELFDNAMPSGGSAAAEVLLRMATLTGDGEYRRKAVLLLESAASYLSVYPLGFGHWLNALEMHLAHGSEVAVVGRSQDPATAALLQVVHSRFLPNLTLVVRDPSDLKSFSTPILEGREAPDGRPTAYVCHDYICDLPTADPTVLAQQLLR